MRTLTMKTTARGNKSVTGRAIPALRSTVQALETVSRTARKRNRSVPTVQTQHTVSPYQASRLKLSAKTLKLAIFPMARSNFYQKQNANKGRVVINRVILGS